MIKKGRDKREQATVTGIGGINMHVTGNVDGVMFQNLFTLDLTVSFEKIIMLLAAIC